MSRMNTSSWFSEDRAKGTCIRKMLHHIFSQWVCTVFMMYMSIEHYACFILTTRFPLHTYKRVSNSSSSGFLNPEATPPSNGIIQGLKYDKNLSDSWPWISLCCTARPPRDASSSTVLMAAVPASSYKENQHVSKD